MAYLRGFLKTPKSNNLLHDSDDIPLFFRPVVTYVLLKKRKTLADVAGEGEGGGTKKP